jgi:hypothetical protein
VSDIRKSGVLKVNFVMNSHGCEINLFGKNNTLRVCTNKRYLTHEPGHPLIKEYEWLNEVLSIILNLQIPKYQNFHGISQNHSLVLGFIKSVI